MAQIWAWLQVLLTLAHSFEWNRWVNILCRSRKWDAQSSAVNCCFVLIGTCRRGITKTSYFIDYNNYKLENWTSEASSSTSHWGWYRWAATDYVQWIDVNLNVYNIYHLKTDEMRWDLKNNLQKPFIWMITDGQERRSFDPWRRTEYKCISLFV